MHFSRLSKVLKKINLRPIIMIMAIDHDKIVNTEHSQHIYFSLQPNIKSYFDFLTALLYSGHDIYSMDFLNIIVVYVLGFTICLVLYLFADSNFLKHGPIGKLRKLSWKVGLVAQFFKILLIVCYTWVNGLIEVFKPALFVL